MEYQKIIKLLDTTSDNVPRFITKKWIEVYDQSGKICNTNKQIGLTMSEFCDYSDPHIAAKGTISVTDPIKRHMIKNWLLNKMLHLLTAF